MAERGGRGCMHLSGCRCTGVRVWGPSPRPYAWEASQIVLFLWPRGRWGGGCTRTLREWGGSTITVTRRFSGRLERMGSDDGVRAFHGPVAVAAWLIVDRSIMTEVASQWNTTEGGNR